MRIERTELYVEMTKLIARRSTCERAQVAALIVLDGRVISQGYNGSPTGTAHCLDVGCLIDEKTGGCIRTIHAEQNAIAYAARHGMKLEGSHLYCSLMPCLSCAKLIINSGIKQVHYLEKYRDETGVRLLRDSGIPVLPALAERYNVTER